MRRFSAAVAATVFCLGLGAAAQDDLAISGKVELSFIADLDNSDNNKSDVNMDISLTKRLSESIAFVGKLDVEDTDNKNDLVEEAWVRWSSPTNSMLDVSLGRMEIEYGQDVDIFDYETYSHEVGEIDNTWALEFGIHPSDRLDLYVTTFDSKGTDTGLFQSYAVQGNIKLMEGLKLNLSYANIHDTAGAEEDDKRLSVGVDYKNELVGLRVFAEYLSLTDYDHSAAADHDGSVMQVGATYDIGEKMLVGLMYATEDINDTDLGGGLDESEIVVAWNLKLDKKNKIFVEYIMQSEADTSQLYAGTVLKF